MCAVSRAPCRLARHLQLPQRSGRPVRVYEGKLRTKDRFITGSEPTLTWQERDGSSWRWETVLQFIGRGERAVPTAALEKRLVHAHRARFDTVRGEHNTTQACSQCYELTSECHRRKRVDVERWVDRDVRRCNSPCGLSRPILAPPHLVSGRLREGCWESSASTRDHNPA
jgi:hypothetical protein